MYSQNHLHKVKNPYTIGQLKADLPPVCPFPMTSVYHKLLSNNSTLWGRQKWLYMPIRLFYLADPRCKWGLQMKLQCVLTPPSCHICQKTYRPTLSFLGTGFTFFLFSFSKSPWESNAGESTWPPTIPISALSSLLPHLPGRWPAWQAELLQRCIDKGRFPEVKCIPGIVTCFLRVGKKMVALPWFCCLALPLSAPGQSSSDGWVLLLRMPDHPQCILIQARNRNF